MARKSSKSPTTNEPISDGTPADGKGESVSGYFRKILTENRKLLRRGSNNKLYAMWLQDHPGHTEVPVNVKQGLSNLKTQLRKKLGKPGPKPAAAATEKKATPIAPTRVRASHSGLQHLEEEIDECLNAAKGFDRAGLEKVIHHLRLARNEVVFKIGQ